MSRRPTKTSWIDSAATPPPKTGQLITLHLLDGDMLAGLWRGGRWEAWSGDGAHIVPEDRIMRWRW